MSKESDKAIEEIIAHLENLTDGEIYVYQEKLPILERLNLCWDFKSQIKHLWLTGYILITWECGFNILETIKTLNISFYSSGSYE